MKKGLEVVVEFSSLFLVKAIYGDGKLEPEVYVDRTDWDIFNVMDFKVINSICV